MLDGIGYTNLSDQYLEEEVFLDTHDQTRSVSLGLQNMNALATYGEIPAGTIMVKCADGYHRPCGAGVVSAAVVAAAVVPLANGAVGGVPIEIAFHVGDQLFVEGQTHSFRITAIDRVAKTLTLAESVSISEGAVVYVDPGVGTSAVNGAVGVAANAIVVDDGEAARFRVGDVITIAGVTGARNITAINLETDTITFDGAASTVADNAKVTVTGAGRGEDRPLNGYKISTATRYTGEAGGYNSPNVLIPCRTHGEVRRRAVKGFREALRSRLPLIQWNDHSN